MVMNALKDPDLAPDVIGEVNALWRLLVVVDAL